MQRKALSTLNTKISQNFYFPAFWILIPLSNILELCSASLDWFLLHTEFTTSIWDKQQFLYQQRALLRHHHSHCRQRMEMLETRRETTLKLKSLQLQWCRKQNIKISELRGKLHSRNCFRVSEASQLSVQLYRHFLTRWVASRSNIMQIKHINTLSHTCFENQQISLVNKQRQSFRRLAAVHSGLDEHKRKRGTS